MVSRAHTPLPLPLIRLLTLAVAVLLAGAMLAAFPTAARAEQDDESIASEWEDARTLSSAYTPKQYAGSMYYVAQEITGAGAFWNDGYTGEGIDVALIDTGVVPVNGLTYKNKVINGPDLSFESQDPDLRYLDTFGHGTHLAGIIAGRDDNASKVAKGEEAKFLGMAPGARLVNVKVADANGTVDVTQVIAAIDWVVQHRADNGMNIRVINLAYGTTGDQSYLSDPLAHAIENAWRQGIVVVVAAGNDGNGNPLRNPAIDPYVIAVGASASDGIDYRAEDDQVAAFSNCGTSDRHVDIVAPGKSIVSLRNPGSAADQGYPKARVEDRFFLGSGTSQASAVVSGGVALLLDQRPDLSPDMVKALLMETATTLTNAKSICQGAGILNLEVARNTATFKAKQTFKASEGKGSLEAARGDAHVELDGSVLKGELDIFGTPWNAEKWAKYSANQVAWDGGDWNGSTWTGNDWSGLSWSGLSWSGLSWSGLSWSGLSWSGLSWSSNTWNGLSWSGLSWSGLSWSGLSWSTDVWTGLSWK
jgi:serine protease AprX